MKIIVRIKNEIFSSSYADIQFIFLNELDLRSSSSYDLGHCTEEQADERT